MEYFSVNQKGLAHESGECEDALYINDDKTVFCLADGVSNARYGAMGARRIVKRCCKEFSAAEFKSFLQNGSADEIRNVVCNVIDDVLNILCKKYNEQNKEAFASTFLALIKTDKNNMTLVHAGDGAIFAQPKTKHQCFATVLSYPDNSPDGKVYSAGNPEQRRRMRVIRVKPEDYNNILLCTDGFSDAYLVPSFQAFNCDALTKVFNVSTEKELAKIVQYEHIATRDITDDISCVLCKINSNKTPESVDTELFVPKKDKDHIDVTGSEWPDADCKQKKIPVNQIDYDTAQKKPKRETQKRKDFRTLYVLFSLLLVLSVGLCFYINALNKANDKQNTELSLLHEEITRLDEVIDSIQRKINPEIIEPKEETDEKNNTTMRASDQSTVDSFLNETTESYSDVIAGG